MIAVMDRGLRVAPLGIRFWDSARDLQVRSGLHVNARSASGFGPTTEAYRTLSDIYAFRGLPGMAEFEAPSATPIPTISPPLAQDMVVVVEDRDERFLPIAFGVTLPAASPPILPRASATSPEEEPTGLMLFSSPSRQLGPGFGTVLGQLVVGPEVPLAPPAQPQVAPNWAAHALVELEIQNGGTWQTLADERGSFVVPFSYPTPPSLLATSPPTLPQGGLSDVSWSATLRVYWNPSTWTDLEGTRLPSYPSLLNQDLADLFAQAPGSPPTTVSEWVGDVHYGEPLIAQTVGSSYLHVVQPVSSP